MSERWKQVPLHPPAKRINKGESGVTETSLEDIRPSQVDAGNGDSSLSINWRNEGESVGKAACGVCQ